MPKQTTISPTRWGAETTGEDDTRCYSEPGEAHIWAVPNNTRIGEYEVHADKQDDGEWIVSVKNGTYTERQERFDGESDAVSAGERLAQELRGESDVDYEALFESFEEKWVCPYCCHRSESRGEHDRHEATEHDGIDANRRPWMRRC